MDKIQNIETKIDKVVSILNQLYNHLYLGYCSFILTHKIQMAWVEGRIINMQELLKITYVACGNASILTLRTLVEEDERKENININFLFRELEEVLNSINKIVKKRTMNEDDFERLWQSKKNYLCVLRQRNEILNSITEDKKHLELLEPPLKILEEKRNNYIAHISKKLLQVDRVEQPVYTEDINKIYQGLFRIIKKYLEFIGEKLEVAELEKLHGIIEGDFNFLMKYSSSTPNNLPTSNTNR